MKLVFLSILLLIGCAGLTSRAYLPPNKYLHSFNGKTLVFDWNPPAGVDFASTAQTIPSLRTCLIRLPRHADEATRECLLVIEIANCNGAIDVNRADVRDREPPPGYERTCATVDLPTVYKQMTKDVKWAAW